MYIKSYNDGSGTKIDGAVYVSEATYQSVGYDPMYVVTDYMTNVLEANFPNNPHEIHGITSSDRPDLATEEVECDQDNGALNEFGEYMNGSPVYDASSFNLCITEYGYYEGTDSAAGCAGGNDCVSEGGSDIADLYGQSFSRYGPADAAHRGVHSCIHEIGHNLGMSHGDGMFSKQDVDDDGSTEYVQSPLAGAKGTNNNCGEYVPYNSGYDVMVDFYYNWCAVSKSDY